MEEILFRGSILNRSKRAFGAIGCIVLSTLMFSFMHMNIVQGLYVIPMGLFWGYIAYRYKSVIPCVICHFINNFTGMLVPINFPPIILFIVFGCIAAFIGVRYGIVDNKEEIENVSEE
jgi:membrane protease YdiL (CAAX protease family)